MKINYEKYGFIFDMDGTLVDNMYFHMRAWVTMLAENDIKKNGEDFLVKTAGKTNREIIPEFFDNVSEEELLRLGNRKEELYRELFRPELSTVEGVVEFLEKSQKLGIKMAVATAAPIENMEFILDGLDLRKYFTVITTAADVQNGKPHPEGFLISAEKLGVEPEKCLVFEDAINGFEAAHRAGMKSVGLATVNSIETILELPDIVVVKKDFIELDPARLIENYLPETLLKVV
jgi:beta-phosphoglucomutase